MAKEQQLMIKIAGKLDSSFNSMLSSVQSGIAGATKALGTATLAGAAAIGAGLTSAVNTGKDFEKSMSQVAATMRLDNTVAEDAETLSHLEGAIRQLGATTSFSAMDAAEAANNLAMAGYNEGEIMAALGTSLNLAGAGALSMGEATEYLTNGLASLGLDKTEENFSHFADVLAITAASATTDVSMMGQAVTTLGATGQALSGVDGDMQSLTANLGASLGILADVGITGSEAGTHLRNMIMSLQKARNSDAQALFDQYDIKTYDEATGQFRDMQDVLQDLDKVMDGMSSDEERNNFLSTIFKQTDLAAASALIAQSGDRYSELYDAAMHASDGMGVAAEMYHTQTDNLQGDLDALGSAVSDFQIEVHKSLNTGLRDTVQTAASMVLQLEDAFKQGGLSGLAETLGSVLSDAMTMAVDKSSGLVEASGKLITGLLGGIERNAGALGAGAAQLVGTLANVIFTAAPQLMQAGGALLLGLLDGMRANLPQIGSDFTSMLTGIFNVAGDLGPQLINAGADALVALADGLAGGSPELVAAAERAVAAISDAIVANAPKLIEAGTKLLAALGKGMMAGIGGFFQDLGTGEATLGGFVSAFGPLLLMGGKVAPIFKLATKGIKAFVPAVKSAGSVTGGLSALFPKLATALGSISPAAVGVVGGIGVIGAAIGSLWKNNEGFRNNITNTWDGIKQSFSNAGSSIKQSLGSLGINFGTITSGLSNAWTGFTSIVAPLAEGAFGVVGSTISTAMGTVSLAVDGVVALFKGDWDTALTDAGQIADTFWTGAESVATSAAEGITGGINSLIELFGGDFQISVEGVRSVVSSAFQGMKQAVAISLRTVNGLATATGQLLSGDFSGAWTTTKETVSAAMEGFGELVSSGIGAAKTWLDENCPLIGTLLSGLGSVFDGLKTAASDAFTGLGELVSDPIGTAQKAMEGAAPLIETAGSAIGGAWDALKSSASGAFDSLVDTVSNALTGSREGMDTEAPLIETAASLISSAWDSITSGASSLGELAGTVGEHIESAKTTITDKAGEFGTLLDSAWSDLVTAVSTGLSGLPGEVTSFITGIPSAVETAAADFGSMLDTGWNALVSAVSGGLEGLPGEVTSFITGIPSAVETAASDFGSMLDTAWTDLKGSVNLLDGMDKDVEGKLDLVSQTLTSIGGTLGGALDAAWNGITSAAGAAADAVVKAWESVKGFFAAAHDFIFGSESSEGFDAAAMSAQEAAQACIDYGEAIGPMPEYIPPIEELGTASEGMSESMASSASEVAASAAEVQSAIEENFGSAAEFASTNWEEIATTVSDKMLETQTTVSETMTTMSTDMQTGWQEMVTTTSTATATILTTVTSFGTSMISAIQTMMEGMVSATTSGFASMVSAADSGMSQLYNTSVSWAQSTVSAIQSAFSSMSITIPAPQLPTINVGTNTVAVGGSSVSVPTFSVSWNALGGIFDDPTIFQTDKGLQGVGEAGPEAILPLDTLWTKMESIMTSILRREDEPSMVDRFLSRLGGGSNPNTPAPQLAAAGAGGGTITYSPVYNLYGNASAEDVRKADRMGQEEFSRLMKQWEKERRRTTF